MHTSDTQSEQIYGHTSMLFGLNRYDEKMVPMYEWYWYPVATTASSRSLSKIICAAMMGQLILMPKITDMHEITI